MFRVRTVAYSPDQFVTSSQDIRGYIAVMASLKFIFFKFKEYCFVKNNRGTSLIGGVFISYDC